MTSRTLRSVVVVSPAVAGTVALGHLGQAIGMPIAADVGLITMRPASGWTSS